MSTPPARMTDRRRVPREGEPVTSPQEAPGGTMKHTVTICAALLGSAILFQISPDARCLP